MKRFGQIIGVDPQNFERYKEYHAAVWPEVLAMITACNISNYSIFHKDGLLFAYMEYSGDDFGADMAKMAADPKTQEWWAIMKTHTKTSSKLSGRGVVGKYGGGFSSELDKIGIKYLRQLGIRYGTMM